MAPPLNNRVYQSKDRRTYLRKRRTRWVHVKNADNGIIFVSSASQPRMNRLSRISNRDSFTLLDTDSQNDSPTIEFEDPWVPMVGSKTSTKQHTHYDPLPTTDDGLDPPEDDNSLEVPLAESTAQDEVPLKTYKRRYWMLLIFALVAFTQYCAWNTYGPIATSAKLVFDWSNTEIAILASMDPITYLVTMMFFSWMMDVKGLRTSMVISTAFMFVGTGLRCVTSNSRYAFWSMGLGQLLNGLAGPVTQAGPPLLSAYWFPSHQRTTATAVAALCGSLGVAMSFLIGPGFVKDLKTELDLLHPKPINYSANVSRTLARYADMSTPLKDSIYMDAVHYWPLDQLNITIKDKPVTAISSSPVYWRTVVMTTVNDVIGGQKGYAFGRAQVVHGVVNESVRTNGHDAWLNLGHVINTCLGDPSLCHLGLTVSFWIRYHVTSKPIQYFLGTSGTEAGYRGFLVYQDYRKDTKDHMTIKIENSTSLWERTFTVPRDTWSHVMFTWSSRDGLFVYCNGSFVGKDVEPRKTYPISPYYTTFTVGRPNNKFEFSNASYDEIAVWYRQLHPVQMRSIYNRLIDKPPRNERQFYEKTKENLIEQGRSEIMMLLYIEFGVTAILFLAVVIYFPAKPPSPPSRSAEIQREDFHAGFKQIIRNPQFWTLGFVYGVTTGVYSGWGASLAVNLETFNVTQSQASWIGFYATIAGIGAGLILARCADLFGGRMKALLVFLFFGSSGCFLWFALLCLKMIPFDNASLYKSSILGGFFVSGTIPLFYELTVETTYPVAEGVTTGLLTLINNSFTVLFLIVLTIPGVGTVWMNWCMFAACAGCIPIMLSFREKYRRLDIDNSRQQTTNILVETKNIKTPLGSSLSICQVNPTPRQTTI